MENPGIKWGVYFMITGIAWKLISYIIGPDFVLGGTSTSISTLLYFPFIILAAREVKIQNGGFAKFGEVFKTSFISLILGVIGITLAFWAMMAFFPEIMDALDAIKEQTREELEGVPDGAMKDFALDSLEEDPTTFMAQVKSIVTRTVLGAIVCAIVAAIMQKKNPADF